MLETANKRNEYLIRHYEEFNVQYVEFSKRKEEKSYRIRNRKTRND